MLKWIMLIACSVQANPFCDGWEAGFSAGYCYQKYSCLAPLAPLCPLQSLKDADGYNGGYNRGFVAGQARRTEKESATSNSTQSYSRPRSSYSTEMNQSMQNFGNAMANAIRQGQERKRAQAEEKMQRQADSVQRVSDSLDIELKRRQIQEYDEKEALKRAAGYGGMTDAEVDSALRAKYPGLTETK